MGEHMRCPDCGFENREGVNFCEECGTQVRQICPRCGMQLMAGRKYCGECGQRLVQEERLDHPSSRALSARCYLTICFSDLSGYMNLTEKLDPEEVKEITDRVFLGISEAVNKYEGFIARFEGDGVLIAFGVPQGHEDDAIRAIRAAREIHSFVESLSPTYFNKTGRLLTMHTGINSGLVVVSELDVEKGTSEFTGDAVNLAARFCSLAKPGAILVGPDTYALTQGFFDFKPCGPITVKGKKKPVQAYEVVSVRRKPKRTSRPARQQATLVGRQLELAQLLDAAEAVRKGFPATVCICGEAGTGKSRLVEEFKTRLNLNSFQLLEAHAFSYTQTISYWPLIDLLSRSWRIEEEDSLEDVREKIRKGIVQNLGSDDRTIAVIGSLYSLDYPELKNMSPEAWKAELFQSITVLLSAMAKARPTILFFEDLHWADPLSLELFSYLSTESVFPALFLCTYRPPFEPFTSVQKASFRHTLAEISLRDLSPSEALEMAESLLNTKSIPLDLRNFMNQKVEGNPFYLEEMIFSLIESGILVEQNGYWRLSRSLSDLSISMSIQGLIAARLDRLTWHAKRVLQEASVIGRNFLYNILENVTEFRNYLQECLAGLERHDLIRTKTIHPELEYAFKHALTQEVVYSGLLKKDRKAAHERIGLVMEKLFHDRLPEIYETLAFHFKNSHSTEKAVEYLIKSGEKSLRRYALDASHQYFQEAFNLIENKTSQDPSAKAILIDILIKWSFVYYYRGDYGELLKILSEHRQLAESLGDSDRLGMFYNWLSCALWHREMLSDAYACLLTALKLGEETANRQVVGYACTWLTWTCIEMGRMEEALEFAERAQEICKLPEFDHYIYFNSLAGMAYAQAHRGEKDKTLAASEALLEFGRKHTNIRSTVMGYCMMGFGRLVEGDIDTAVTCYRHALRTSADPWYSQFPKLALCYARVAHGDFEGIREDLEQILAFSESRGAEYIGSPAKALLGAIMFAQGEMTKGLKMLEETALKWFRGGSMTRYVQAQIIIGRIYAAMAQGTGRKGFAVLAKNIGFLLKEAPFADRKGQDHLSAAAKAAEQMGAKDLLGRACLSLGLLHKSKGRNGEACEYLGKAVRVFEESGAYLYSQTAKEALAAIRPLEPGTI